MNHLALDANSLAGGELRDFPAGTLLLVPSDSQNSVGPFWAIRFDGRREDDVVRSVLWLNGMPWHGSDPDSTFYGMPLEGDGYGRMAGISCGAARIEIDATSGAGRMRREMRWDQAAGYVAVGCGGKFLLAEKPGRASIWRPYHAINVDAWDEAAGTDREAPVEWFSRWSLVVGTKDQSQRISFEARGKTTSRSM